MRLSKVKIENFRGIAFAEIELQRDITVLVGENNAGKTSVLEALRLCLDAVKSEKACNFTEFDFYRDETSKTIAECKPIALTLTYLESENHPWPDYIMQSLNEVIVGSEYSVIKLRVNAEYDVDAGEPAQSWCFLDDADNEMVGKHNHIKDLRRLRPFFFQTALRAAKDEFHGQSTYWSSFLRNKDIDDATQKALEKELLDVNRKIVDAHGSFKQVTEELKRISDLVAVGKIDAVTVDPAPADIYRTLRYGTDVNLLTASNAKIPIRSHGEGTQSLSVLLLFSAYLKTRLQDVVDKQAEPIISIEEPEAHLHPNAVRTVWQILEGFPGQKIVATHSGDILSEVPLESLRRMNRQGATIECKAIPANLLSDEESRKFNHHVRRNRGELLFAKIWVLVEGETDVSVLAECADILDVDFCRLGIRIVECSQAGGPGVFVKVADAIGIKWHLVADGDVGGKKYVDNARALLNGRLEADYISFIDFPNIDILLCCGGYGQPYLDGVGPKKEGELAAFVAGTQAYWEEVYKLVKNGRFSKPEAALKSILMMKDKGKSGVPTELLDIINRINSIAGAP